jgi:hypothetical protein
VVSNIYKFTLTNSPIFLKLINLGKKMSVILTIIYVIYKI